MLAKSIILAAASAVVASAYSIPACWETCFEKYQIQSEGCLCSAPLEAVVTSCISVGCPANNVTSSSTAYEAWLSSYCGEGPVTTTEISSYYTTVCPATEGPSSYTTSTVSTVWTSLVPATYTWTAPVTTTITVSSSVSVATWTPGVNTWTGAQSVAWAPVTTAPVTTGWATTPATTGSWPTTTPPPYVAGAAGLKVGGVLGAVAGVAALML